MEFPSPQPTSDVQDGHQRRTLVDFRRSNTSRGWCGCAIDFEVDYERIRCPSRRSKEPLTRTCKDPGTLHNNPFQLHLARTDQAVHFSQVADRPDRHLRPPTVVSYSPRNSSSLLDLANGDAVHRGKSR